MFKLVHTTDEEKRTGWPYDCVGVAESGEGLLQVLTTWGGIFEFPALDTQSSRKVVKLTPKSQTE